MGYNIIRKEKTYEIMYILLGSCIIGFLYLYQLNTYKSIVIVNDEFGYWGVAAFLAGKEWKSLMATTPYYSFGYSLLLVPLYWLGLKPSMMYQIAILINIVLVIVSFYISILCSKELFDQYDFKSRWVSCLAISCYTNNIIQAQTAWTEILLYFLVWLLFYIFIRNIKYMSYKNIISGICVAGYMYCVHQRMIGVLLCYLILLLFHIFTYKAGYGKLPVLLIVAIGILFINHFTKSYIIDNLFVNDDLVAMNNAAGQTSKITDILTTGSGFLMFIQSLFGKIYYSCVSSFYVIPIAMLIGSMNICSEIKKSILKKKLEYDKKIYIYLFSFLSFLSLLFITAIAMYINKGRLDLLIYGRYMEVAVGPVLLIGFMYLINNKKIKKYMIPIVIGIGLISILVNYGLVGADSDTYNAICATALNVFFKYRTSIAGLSFFITAMTLIPVFLFFFFDERTVRYIGCLCIMLIWIGLGLYSTPKEQQKNVSENVEPIADRLDKEADIRNIYFIEQDTELNDEQTYIKYLQFSKPDDTIETISVAKAERMVWEKGDYLVCDSQLKVPEEILSTLQILEKTSTLKMLAKK